MGTPWRAQGVRTSIVHQYGTVERPVEHVYMLRAALEGTHFFLGEN